eukprot:601932-Ditylum_brightwellii.AAC.1
MDKTILALEKRMEKLSLFADNAKTSAINAKRNGQTSLALLHMKRRKMSLEELERCTGTLLNLESAAASLRRAQSDAQVVKCYETIRGAMTLVRKSEEEGGLGLTEDVVSNTINEMAEEFEELGRISDSMDAMIGGDQGDNIDDEMLEDELRSLGISMPSYGNGDSPEPVDCVADCPPEEKKQTSEQDATARCEPHVESDYIVTKKHLETV